MDILKNLNKKQKEAASTLDGPLLILAGPGSGKTRTLTHRIAYLVSEGVEPHNILAVTFTNKAASEMKQRVLDLLKTNTDLPLAKYQLPTVGTFHSICAKILRTEAPKLNRTSDFTIYDDGDQALLIKKIMQELDMDTKQLPPKKIAYYINNAKDKLITPDKYTALAGTPTEKKAGQVYLIYQKKLQEINAFDFGDLITQTVFLFKKDKSVLKKYQERFKYILVDEYQDTNTAQYEWLHLLAEKYKNICVVGDDAQAIYSWRNADFQNILDFNKDWPNAKIIKLEQNYRSTQNIINAANAVIQNNSLGYKKSLWTQNEEGNPIVICELGNEYEEAEFMVDQIQHLTEQDGYSLNDFVVLFRTNAQSRAIEQTFLRYDIPYKIVGGLRFYQRQEVKDVIAWLRLLQNENDTASWQRLQRLRLGDLKKSLKDTPKNKQQAINSILNILKEKLKENPTLTQLVKYIIKISNFENILKDGTDKGEERWENVKELLSVTEDFGQINVQEAMGTFLENVTLAQEADNVETQSNLVHLMTLHMAKGLEFPVVFIAGCEEGILPHSSSMLSADELEEERRLFYVGLTRAKNLAYMLFVRRRMVWGNTQLGRPSSFLHELPQQYIKFKPLNEEFEEEEEENIIEID